MKLARPCRSTRIDTERFCDARLLRGLLALLLVRVQGLASEELAGLDLREWFTQLGLERQLSPSRSNGLHAVLQRMAELASNR